MGKLAAAAELMDPAPSTDVDHGPERAPTPDEMSALLALVAAAPSPPHDFVRALAQLVRVLVCCPWLDGALRIELGGDATATTVHVFTERAGVRAIALPSVVVDLAIDGVADALEATRDLFGDQNVVSTMTLS